LLIIHYPRNIPLIEKEKEIMKMSKLILAILASGCLAGVASANQIQAGSNGSVPYNWSFVGADGLSLNGYVEGVTKNGTYFESMCLETGEPFTPGDTY
jgi:hypothetical protein